jgi:gliding motility-associated-like protein
MKRIVFILLLTMVIAISCNATHIFGGELLYQHLTGGQYRITLTLYGDCSGSAFSSLASSTPTLYIYKGAQFRDSVHLQLDPNSVEEVSPVCPKDFWNTTCKGGTLPGVTRYAYTDVVFIPAADSNWRFVFNGYMGASTGAGRSNAITNIIQNTTTTSSIMYLEARLNNMQGGNNSPQYTTIPTPFYCNNIAQQYNQGASDSDNDSLVFSLTPALEKGNPVSYVPPYTSVTPMATSNFTFNSVNGQMNFTPNMVQDALIVNLVEEYRNGVFVGSSMREMTFIVIGTCSNNPPQASFSNTKGGVYVGNYTMNICEGTDEVSFKTTITDKDNDDVTVSIANAPAGAVINVVDNNTSSPIINFDWSTGAVAPGVYNIFVNFKDNACPLASSQTIAITLKILKPAEVVYTVINPTRCLFQQHVQLGILYGALPRTVTISQNNAVLKSYLDTTGVLQDFFKTGSYHVFVSSPYLLCNSDFDFTVVDSGAYPYHPEFVSPHYCVFDTPEPLIVKPGQYGQITWHDMEGNLLPGTPTFTTDKPGIYEWLVSELYHICESRRDTIRVFVHPKPDAEILNKPEQQCSGDLIYLMASGGATYTWLPSDKVSIDKDGAVSTRVIEPTTYTVIAESEYGCKDTTSIIYADVQPCCVFSYPNAFTPNGDGHNDGFRVTLYGNESSYELSVYNRWGQRVFHTGNPKEYWNGLFGGKDCEIGTYYYYMRAKCYSGREEEHKGEVILIR